MFNLSRFLSYVFIMTFTPGPNNIFSMATANKYGFKKSLEYSIGVFVGFFIIMTLASYFNLFFFNLIPQIEVFMQLLGATYMIYLAYKIMKPKEVVVEEDGEVIAEAGGSNLFFTAIGLQFINPKGILYAVTLVSNFIIPYYQSNLALILFSLLVSSVTILSTVSWALFGSLFNRFLSSYQRQFDIIMGLLLIYLAISISGLMDFI